MFKFEGEKKDEEGASQNEYKTAKEKIESRRPIRNLYCHIVTQFCRTRRDRKLFAIGEDRLSESLDVVTFIRNQLMLKATLKAMLSIPEKYLVKNQKKFALDSDDSTSEEEEDFNFDP